VGMFLERVKLKNARVTLADKVDPKAFIARC